MDILSNVLLKLRDTQRVALERPQGLSYMVADEKRSELRLGKGDGRISDIVGYYQDMKYAAWKATLPTYQAPWLIPDLYVTGKFHRSIRAKYHDGVYDLYTDRSSEPYYAGELLERYNQPRGLSMEGEFRVVEKISRQMQKEIARIWTK